jgi:hypothetical protein
MSYSVMNILSFIGVFKNIMFEGVFGGKMEVLAFFGRKRYSEQDIFRDVQKKIDFPKVISDFAVEIAGLDEQKEGAREVDDKGHHEPKVRFLVNEDDLWFVHLVEQVEDRVGHDEDGFDGRGEGVEAFFVVADAVEVHGNGKSKEKG